MMAPSALAMAAPTLQFGIMAMDTVGFPGDVVDQPYINPATRFRDNQQREMVASVVTVMRP